MKKEQMEIKVSVIIPVYNEEKYLDECIKSLLQQDLDAVEIVFVDDGSTDASWSIIEGYQKEHTNIKLLCNSNQGAGMARNAGIREAAGKYVIFMDADDYYPNEHTLSHLFEASEKNQAKLCAGCFSIIYPDLELKEFEGKMAGYTFKQEGFISGEEYQFDYGYHRFLFLKEFLLENNLEFPDFRRYQDPPFMAKALQLAGKFYAIPEICYCFRESSQKHTWTEKMCADMLKGVGSCLEISNENQWKQMHYLNVMRLAQDFRGHIAMFECCDSVKREMKKIRNKINWEWIEELASEQECEESQWLRKLNTLQNLILPSTEYCEWEEMYYHRNLLVHYVPNGAYLSFYKEGEVKFDGYMNYFTAAKWRKYCGVKELLLNIDAKGSFEITLYKTVEGENGLEDVILCTKTFEQGDRCLVSIPFEITSTKNELYKFKMTALEDGVEFHGGSYSIVRDRSVQEKKTHLAIVICTFRREEFILKNLEMFNRSFIENEISDLYGNLDIFVVDNGKTLDQSEVENEYVHLFYNKNVGGSGGFTRGLIEVYKVMEQKGITNVLLMDDDIVIMPESIERTYHMLMNLEEKWQESYIGGAMLSLDDKWKQVESGANWSKGCLTSYKSGLDLRNKECCYFNEIEEEYGYNAWWFCCMPVSILREDNFPLPLFIREDDIEYGLRNMKNLILLNGICVWHLPFDKKYSSMLYYYTMRNRLIDCATLGLDYSYKEFKRDFWGFFKYELFTYRYKNARLLLMALEDYMKGIEWFAAQDGEDINQKVGSMGYQLKDISELDCQFDMKTYRATMEMLESRKNQIKRMLTLNGMFNRKNGYTIVPTFGVHIAHVYGADKVLNYDKGSQKGFVTLKNKKEFWSLVAGYMRTMGRLKRRYKALKTHYYEERNQIRSLSFWEKYLQI